METPSTPQGLGSGGNLLEQIRAQHGGPGMASRQQRENALSIGHGDEEDDLNPAGEIDQDIRESIESRIQEVPPSERDKYIDLLEQLDRRSSGKGVRVYYQTFELTDSSDCFAFEDLVSRKGFVTVKDGNVYQDGSRLLYWVAAHVRPALYAQLRSEHLSPEERTRIEKEGKREEDPEESATGGGTAPAEESGRSLWGKVKFKAEFAAYRLFHAISVARGG